MGERRSRAELFFSWERDGLSPGVVNLGRSSHSCRKGQVGPLLSKFLFLTTKLVSFFIQKLELPRFTLYKPNLNSEVLKYLFLKNVYIYIYY